jgi:hypothetical protein
MNSIRNRFSTFDLGADFVLEKLIEIFLEYPYVTTTILDSYLQQCIQTEFIVQSIKQNIIYFHHKSMILHSKYFSIKDQLLFKKLRFVSTLHRSINPELKEFYVPTEFIVIEVNEFNGPLQLMEDMELSRSEYTFACKVISVEKQFTRTVVTIQDTSGTASFVLGKDQLALGDLIRPNETLILKHPLIENGVLYFGPRTILYSLVQAGPKLNSQELQGIFGYVTNHIPNDELNQVFTIGLEIQTPNAIKLVYFYGATALIAAQVKVGHQVYVPLEHSQPTEYSVGSKIMNISKIESIPASSLCPLSNLDSSEPLFYTDATVEKITPMGNTTLRKRD